MFPSDIDTEFITTFFDNFQGEKTLKNITQHFAQNYPHTNPAYKRSFAINVVGNNLIGKDLPDHKLFDLLEDELSKVDLTKPTSQRNDSTVKETTKLSIFDADRLDGNAFQDFVAELLKLNGYTEVEVIGRSGDQGGDLFATKDEERFVIQAKRYSIDRKVTNSAVQEALGAVGYYDVNRGVVITNTLFTNSAKDLAEKTGITLWNRQDVTKFIENCNLKNKENHGNSFTSYRDIFQVRKKNADQI